jgi:hypothetical protein
MWNRREAAARRRRHETAALLAADAAADADTADAANAAAAAAAGSAAGGSPAWPRGGGGTRWHGEGSGGGGGMADEAEFGAGTAASTKSTPAASLRPGLVLQGGAGVLPRRPASRGRPVPARLGAAAVGAGGTPGAAAPTRLVSPGCGGSGRSASRGRPAPGGNSTSVAVVTAEWAAAARRTPSPDSEALSGRVGGVGLLVQRFCEDEPLVVQVIPERE